MGSRPTATLIFGFKLEGDYDAEEPYPWGEDCYDEFYRWCDEKLGREPLVKPNNNSYGSPEWKEYLRIKRENNKLRPFEIAMEGCCDDHTDYFSSSNMVSADWDCSVEIPDDIRKIMGNDQIQTMLRNEMFNFCNEHGIIFSEPKWQLIAFYG